MRWRETLRTPVRGWQVAGGLAVGSLVPAIPWRALDDTAGGLVGYEDAFAVVFIILDPVIDSPEIGVTLAWLLVGWLTYEYAHLLYPDEFEDVVNYRGFRLLTTVVTLYFGVVVWGSTTERAITVQVVPHTFPAVMLAVVVGIVGGATLFGMYLWHWHPEPLYERQGDLTGLWQAFLPDEHDSGVEKLPERWRSFYYWQESVTFSAFPVLLCVLIGAVAVILQLFYPLPEAAFVGGLVAVRVWPHADSTAGVPRYEVDSRLVDAISGATQNLKGFFMILISALGTLLSGFLFVTLAVVFVTAMRDVNGVDGWSLGIPVAVAFLLALVSMGVYSLLHWVRQLERIEPYARFWAGENEVPETDDASIPTRPPGLLVPTYLPLVGILVMGAVLQWTESSLLGAGVLVVCSILSLVVMGWGLVWTRRHHDDPQSLRHESRDLLVTVLIPIVLVMSIAVVSSGITRLNHMRGLIGVVALVLLTVAYYVPEVYEWDTRQKGFRKLLSDGYFTLIILLMIVFVRLEVEGSTLLVEAVLLGILTMLIVGTLVEIYLERIVE